MYSKECQIGVHGVLAALLVEAGVTKRVQENANLDTVAGTILMIKDLVKRIRNVHKCIVEENSQT